MLRGKDIALSLLVVGSAAAAGYVLRAGRGATPTSKSQASIGARLVDEIPSDATIVDVSSRRLGEIPRARRTIDRAIRSDAHDEWAHETIDDDRAWTVVDEIRSSLPYYEGSDMEYNGVYVHVNGQVVVLDAIGWAQFEEPVA